MADPNSTGISGKLIQRIFLFFCLLPFALLPLLSLDAGISGDEPVHYDQAEKVYRYFATGGKDTAAIHTPITYLKYYGQSIDNFSYLINKTFHLNRPYVTRHIMNALAGATTVLFAGLLAAEFAGYGAGILAIISLLLSPVFLGHTFNNLKDVPFALGYIASVFFLLKFIRKMPRIHYGYLAGMVAATGFTISVRIGGLVIIPIILAFTGLQALLSMPPGWKERTRFLMRITGVMSLAVLLAWLAGLADWPYGLQAPVRHSLESLNQMTHYMITLRQLFEGKLQWSETLPWYYAPKYFLITTPAIILAGLLFCISLPKTSGLLPFFLLIFCAFFPLFWVIAEHSNLYGNIRHLLFIYPLLVVLSAAGWSLIHEKLNKPVFRWSSYLILAVGLSFPLLHIIRNHPVEYVYFNRISGGVEKAYHRYETDYYYHSLGPATAWLEKEILSKPGSDTLIIASNFPLDPILADRFPHVRTVYTTWYDRGRYNWDYGLFVNAYLGPSGLQGKTLLPSQICHTVSVDGLPVCHVLNRKDKCDLQGYEMFAAGRFAESAGLLDAYVRNDPGNETAWLYLGWSLRRMKDYQGSCTAAAKLMTLHSESEPARELLIWNYLDTKQFDKALKLSEELSTINSKYPPVSELMKASRDSLAGTSR